MDVMVFMSLTSNHRNQKLFVIYVGAVIQGVFEKL